MSSAAKKYKLKRDMQDTHRRFRTMADLIIALVNDRKRAKRTTLRTLYRCWAEFKSAATAHARARHELGSEKSEIEAKDEISS